MRFKIGDIVLCDVGNKQQFLCLVDNIQRNYFEGNILAHTKDISTVRRVRWELSTSKDKFKDTKIVDKKDLPLYLDMQNIYPELADILKGGSNA